MLGEVSSGTTTTCGATCVSRLYDVGLIGTGPPAFNLSGFERVEGVEYAHSWQVGGGERTPPLRRPLSGPPEIDPEPTFRATESKPESSRSDDDAWHDRRPALAAGARWPRVKKPG